MDSEGIEPSSRNFLLCKTTCVAAELNGKSGLRPPTYSTPEFGYDRVLAGVPATLRIWSRLGGSISFPFDG